MRSLPGLMLVAFACGVCTLQICATLPPWPAAIAVVGAVAACLAMRLRAPYVWLVAFAARTMLGFGFAGRFGDYVQRARESVRERIVRALGAKPYAGVIVALTIGDQRAIPEAQWTVFNRTGIAHLVSISGLHVTVFAAFAGGVAFLLA